MRRPQYLPVLSGIAATCAFFMFPAAVCAFLCFLLQPAHFYPSCSDWRIIRYPTPMCVRIYLGCAGSASIFLRSVAINTQSDEVSDASYPPHTSWMIKLWVSTFPVCFASRHNNFTQSASDGFLFLPYIHILPRNRSSDLR